MLYVETFNSVYIYLLIKLVIISALRVENALISALAFLIRLVASSECLVRKIASFLPISISRVLISTTKK
jgi:hypothetical protein